MSYGGLDFSWLTSLFNQTPNVTAGVDPSAWTPQTTPPSPAGTMPISPEMGGGADRLTGLNAVDALGSGGGNVNAASSVMAGQQATDWDKFLDRMGIGTPKGMTPEAKRAMEALLKMMGPPQGQQKGQGAPSIAPMQAGFGTVQPYQQAQRGLPRYPWTQRGAPAGLLYE